MTLTEERELVALMRLMSPTDVDAWIDQSRSDHDLDVATLDQIDAAVAEVTRTKPAFQATFRMPHSQWVDLPLEGRMLIFSGVLRCNANACEHAALGGRPLLSMLGARVTTCADCSERFRPALRAADRDAADRTGRGRLCDLCLEEPDDFRFLPFAVQVGPTRLVGDVCAACSDLLGISHTDEAA